MMPRSCASRFEIVSQYPRGTYHAKYWFDHVLVLTLGLDTSQTGRVPEVFHTRSHKYNDGRSSAIYNSARSDVVTR